MTGSKPVASASARPLSPALDTTFKIGLVLKGLDGILEVVGGILLLFLSPHAIEHLVRMLTAHELTQDPHDLIATHLLHTASHLTTSTTLFGPSTCSATAPPRSCWWSWCCGTSCGPIRG